MTGLGAPLSNYAFFCTYIKGLTRPKGFTFSNYSFVEQFFNFSFTKFH
jgi:hypothetical protein